MFKRYQSCPQMVPKLLIKAQTGLKLPCVLLTSTANIQFGGLRGLMHFVEVEGGETE